MATLNLKNNPDLMDFLAGEMDYLGIPMECEGKRVGKQLFFKLTVPAEYQPLLHKFLKKTMLRPTNGERLIKDFIQFRNRKLQS